MISQSRLGDRVQLQPGHMHSSLMNLVSGEKYFGGYILSSRPGYQFTRRFYRITVRYNGFSRSLEIDPLLTNKVSPSHVYLSNLIRLDRALVASKATI